MKHKVRLTGIVLAVILILSTAGCSFISQEDLDDLESQIDDLESQIEELEDELDEIKEMKDNPSTQNEEPSENTNDTPAQEDEPEPQPQEEEDISGFFEEEVLSQLEITEYTYTSDYSDYVFLAVKNNSPYTITLYGEILFRDDNGDLIGTTSDEERAFESGTEILLEFYNEDSFTNYEYTLYADAESYYKPIVSSLSPEITITESKVIVAVTNTSDKVAKYVQYSVLFFSGDTIVDYDWGYCTDDDSEIKAGKTNYDEATTYEEFDSALVFLSGNAAD